MLQYLILSVDKPLVPENKPKKCEHEPRLNECWDNSFNHNSTVSSINVGDNAPVQEIKHSIDAHMLLFQFVFIF